MTDQGNVRVLCRFRPLNDKEKQMSEQLCVDFSSDQQTVVIHPQTESTGPLRFNFTHTLAKEDYDKDTSFEFTIQTEF